MKTLLLASWLGSAAAWAALTWGLWRGRVRTAATPGSAASAETASAWGAIILGVAVVLRLGLVFTTEPMLSDDIHRYVHDGIVLGLRGENPYLNPPARSGVDFAGNNRDLVTIYQPFSQLVFAGIAQISTDERVFRLVFALLDVGIVALLLAALRVVGRSAWWAALYAWHPLVITEVAWSGHQDVIGVAPLVGALLLATLARGAAEDKRRLGWAIGAGVALALAVAVKPLVLPLALPLAWSLRRHPGAIVAAAAATAAGVAALYLPFALMDGGLAGMMDTARRFTRDWSFNGSMHALAWELLGSKPAADRVMTLMLLGALLAATFTADLWRAAVVYLLGGVLLSSTVHPWYLLWAMALLPVRFSPTLWVFGLTAPLAYTVALRPPGEGWVYEPLMWARWVEYVPVYAVMVGEVVMCIRPRDSRLLSPAACGGPRKPAAGGPAKRG